MNKTFLTSDWHLYHKNIQKYCPTTRYGADHIEMTNLIVHTVFSQTKPGDIIYNVGDVSFGTYDQTHNILKLIKDAGIKHYLIRGNHDHNITSDMHQYFEGVHDVLNLNLGRRSTMVMSHFPFAVWDRCHHGSFHVHGHSHGSFSAPGRIMDVGLDTRPKGDMTMWELDEVVEILKTKEFNSHH
jgi:calcineurin-like phosphoesterase family protein